MIVRIAWYLGVDIGDGLCDIDAVFSRKSKVAFEWSFQSPAGDVQRYIVTPEFKNVPKTGIPVPECVRKSKAPLIDLERLAGEAAAGAVGQLQERFGGSDLAVACKYIGIVGANGVDANASRLQGSMAAFEWTIRDGECEWKEDVSARVRDCSTCPIPLPSCTVTHERLHEAARAASQAASDLFGFQINCVYPAIRFYYGKGGLVHGVGAGSAGPVAGTTCVMLLFHPRGRSPFRISWASHG